MLDGEESAFEAFFEATYPVLYRFALVRLGFDRDAAGDVAQAAICKAIGKLRTFRGARRRSSPGCAPSAGTSCTPFTGAIRDAWKWS